MSSQTCYHCTYYAPRKQDNHIQDWWCYRFDIRILDNAPKCQKFEKREGPEGLVNAPYLGYMKREEDRNLEEKKRQEDADRKHEAIIENQRKIVAIMLLTVIISGVGAFIQYGTSQIVAESSIPNDANLLIYGESESDELTFDRADLANSNPNSADMDITIHNRGRVASGPITIGWNVTTSNSSFRIWKSLGNIPNIEGGDRKLVQMNIMCHECYGHYDGDHENETLDKNLLNLVPKGVLKLKLIVKCSQCTPDQQMHIEPFNICLYDEPKECKPFPEI